MARTGRPRHLISKEEFEKLCDFQCTSEECASWFGCEISTLQRWVKMTYKKTFAAVFAEKKNKGKLSLRRSIFQRAKDPDGPPAIAIFVAKNHLGMSDKVETTTDINVAPIVLIPAMTREQAEKLLEERCKLVPQKP